MSKMAIQGGAGHICTSCGFRYAAAEPNTAGGAARGKFERGANVILSCARKGIAVGALEFAARASNRASETEGGHCPMAREGQTVAPLLSMALLFELCEWRRRRGTMARGSERYACCARQRRRRRRRLRSEEPGRSGREASGAWQAHPPRPSQLR